MSADPTPAELRLALDKLAIDELESRYVRAAPASTAPLASLATGDNGAFTRRSEF